MKNQEDTSKYSKNEIIERYLCKEYEFRFNTIKSKSEFRKKSNSSPFIPISTYNINSLRRELDKSGIATTTDNLRAIIVSDFAVRVDPIKQYFLALLSGYKSKIVN
jgi:uncharacterized protein YlaI